MLLPIKIFPDPILRIQAEPVTEFNAELHGLLTSMVETMYHEAGIGLAAPQIGVSKRIAVVDVSDDGNQPMEFINPQIIAEEGSVPSEEGCLSIPRYRDSLKRKERITVTAVDRHGKPFQIDADGLLAICLQHEIDHLNGILFIDRLSRLKKEFFKRWLKKQASDEE